MAKNLAITVTTCFDESHLHDACYYIVESGSSILNAEVDEEKAEGYVYASCEDYNAFLKKFRKTPIYIKATISWEE